MVSKHYCLAPWELVGEGQDRPPGWNPPVGYSSVVDLRNRSDSGQLTLGDRPYGFFAGESSLPVPSGAELLGTGDCRDILTTTDVQNTWQGMTGYRPQGTYLVDLLWDQLTNGADADGVTSVAPLVPNHLGIVELLLNGHSVVRIEQFGDIRGNGQWNVTLRKQLQNQFARHFARDQIKAEMVLGNTCNKYRLRGPDEWKQLVPTSLVRHTQGPRKPQTSIIEAMTGYTDTCANHNFQFPAGNTYLGYTTGAGKSAHSTTGAAAHTTSLSSDDHWAEIEWMTNSVGSSGSAWRCGDVTSTTLNDYYYCQRFGGLVYVTVVSNASPTNLSNASMAFNVGDIDRGKADGTTISLFVNTVQKISITNTGLTGQLQCGWYMASAAGGPHVKDFEAADLAAAGTNPKGPVTGIMFNGPMRRVVG